MRTSLIAAMLWSFAACSSTRPQSTDELSCGAGTELINNVCLPVVVDAGARDAGPVDGAMPDSPPDAPPDAPADAAPDAAIQIDEATSFAIDPAHDNLQPTDTIASPLTPRWAVTLGIAVSYPLVVGKLAIVSALGSPATVRALDITTGTLVWGPIAFTDEVMLAYDAGRVFVLDHQGRMTALDLVTGLHLWSTQILGESDFRSPPVAGNGAVFVNGAGSAGMTFALDEQTGALRWQSSTDGTGGCVAVSSGVVYESEACDNLTAWSALTGATLWKHTGTCTGYAGYAPSVFGGKIWQRDVAQGDVIYDLHGTPVGTFESYAVPAFHAGTAFYVVNQTVKAVDIATNTTRWTFTGDGQICTSPVIAGAGGQVFVGSSLGHVYELDETTGAQRSVHTIGTGVTCYSETRAMTVGEGHLLVPAGNQLIAY